MESLSPLNRALALFGPLEQRILGLLWRGTVAEPFVVRDVQVFLPELAYTTVMTTLNRLADKQVLSVEPVPGQRAHIYRVPYKPEEYLIRVSREQVSQIIERFGELAMAAFAERLECLSPEQLQRLRDLGES